MHERKPALTLPTWDLISIFPSLNSDEFKSTITQIQAEIAALSTATENGPRSNLELATLLGRYNAVLELAETAEGYAACLFLEDSRSTLASSWITRTRRMRAELQQIEQRMMTHAADISAEAEPHCPEILQDHRYWMRQAHATASHRLSADEERMALELNESGGAAWEMLRHQIVGGLAVYDDLIRSDISLVTLQQRNRDPDRPTRERAYQLELGAWASVAPTLAAALNSIKVEALVMSRRRGWESTLDQSLSENRIDQDVLDAMLSAAERVLPDLRRYLAAKATLLGVRQLTWYDLYAPVGADEAQLPFDSARDLILDQFGRYSSNARHLGETAFNEHWIDAEPRPHKRAGGVNVSLGGGRSRILTNYHPSHEGVRMLTHELGHAYHARVLEQARRSAVQRWATPWVMAETAAIFFETIVRDAAIDLAPADKQLVAIEANLQLLCRRVADILCAFRFEEELFRRRPSGHLAADDLTHLMSSIQSNVYGGSLNQDTRHPYMWAVLPHYYSTESSFNNYPYMFATLLSLGLYAQFEADPSGFSHRFDEMLSLSGMDDVVSLTNRFGIDLRSPDFWHFAMELVRRDIDRFTQLVQISGSEVS